MIIRWSPCRRFLGENKWQLMFYRWWVGRWAAGCWPRRREAARRAGRRSAPTTPLQLVHAWFQSLQKTRIWRMDAELTDWRWQVWSQYVGIPEPGWNPKMLRPGDDAGAEWPRAEPGCCRCLYLSVSVTASRVRGAEQRPGCTGRLNVATSHEFASPKRMARRAEDTETYQPISRELERVETADLWGNFLWKKKGKSHLEQCCSSCLCDTGSCSLNNDETCRFDHYTNLVHCCEKVQLHFLLFFLFSVTPRHYQTNFVSE